VDEYKKSELIRVNMVWMPTREVYYNEIVYQMTPFKGIMATFPANVGSDIEFMLSRFYESTGDSSPYPDPKTDELIVAQRRATDPGKRAEVLKDFQRHVATTFPVVPSHGLFAGWSFQWPWLHNINQPGYLQWLDANMPKRNG
jgi:ABC-type transport system substrate-binding protein